MAKERRPEKEAELRKKIEEITGIIPQTPHDFTLLANMILMRTKKRVSSTTLKRFWNYIEKDNDTNIRVSALNLLSNFIGYTSWFAFCDAKEGEVDCSDFVLTNILNVTELPHYALVRIIWDPERCLTVRYEGSDLFTVVESVNSKLSKGDTFHCTSFVDLQPLLLTEVVHEGMPPCSYLCGRLGGVKVTLL